MTDSPFRVLVLGGYGVFGQRLCRRLAAGPGLSILLAGRSQVKADAMVRAIRADLPDGVLEPLALDGQSPALGRVLAERAVDLVIHAAGPFQGQDYRVAQCCIDRRVHYLDLADGRDFVCGIGRLDGAARAAGVQVISGVSSVPGLSSAVAERLAAGLTQVERIAIGISPSSRAVLGQGAIAGILSYCGRPIRLWRDGRWQRVFGLQDLQRRTFQVPDRPPVGPHWLGACEVPDLSLLPARYPGVATVTFHAGPELAVLMAGLWCLAWLVRLRLLGSLGPLAGPAQRLSGWLGRLGADRGAMVVELVGTTGDGRRLRRTWTLVAECNHGPFVPCLPAVVLTRQLAAGQGAAPGARPCLALFDLAAVGAAAEGLEIHWAEAVRDA